MDGATCRGRAQRATLRRAMPNTLATSPTGAVPAHSRPTEFSRACCDAQSHAPLFVEQLKRPARCGLCAYLEIAKFRAPEKNRMCAAGPFGSINFNFSDLDDCLETGGGACTCRETILVISSTAWGGFRRMRFAWQDRAGHSRDHLPLRKRGISQIPTACQARKEDFT